MSNDTDWKQMWEDAGKKEKLFPKKEDDVEYFKRDHDPSVTDDDKKKDEFYSK